MPDVELDGKAIPWLGATGLLKISTPGGLNQRLADSPPTVAAAALTSGAVSIASGGGWSLSVTAETRANVAVIKPSDHATARDLNLDVVLGSQPDLVALVLILGGEADGAFGGTFRYGPLSGSATLSAGADVSYRYARCVGGATTVQAALPDLLKNVRLPAALTTAPQSGEVIEFGYGGSLTFGAALSAGYHLSGTASTDVGLLKLSEAYNVSAAGTLSVGAKLAGLFSVQVRRDDVATGGGWTRVQVKKNKSRQFTFAADVTVEALPGVSGLPHAPNEFLAALLGVNAHGWVNVLEQMRDYSDWPSLEGQLDALTTTFLETYLNQGFDELKATPLATVLDRVAKVVDAYNNLDATVVDVFERYYAKITDPELGPQITKALETIQGLKSWDDLKGSVSGLDWELVDQLTDGDPLGFVVNKSVALLQRRALDLLQLVHGIGGDEIPAFIDVIKSEVGIDPLLQKLGTIDSVDKLAAQADTALGAFINRLMGVTLGAIQKNADLVDLFNRIHAVTSKTVEFETNLYQEFQSVLTNTYALNLHASYARASSDDVLLDVSFDLDSADGSTLYQKAIAGDLGEALAAYRSPAIRVNHGELTHSASRTSTLDVNVLGWHDGWHYHGVEQLLAQSRQQIVGNAQGGVTITTAIDVSDDRDRASRKQQVHTHFLLRLAGESTGLLQTDTATHDYLVNAVTRMDAAYTLDLVRPTADAAAVAFYLSFAESFGIGAASGFDPKTVLALLQSSTGQPATALSVTYNVRYDGAVVQRLFTTAAPESLIRLVMRRVVLADYLHEGGEMAANGWAYWTPGIYPGWVTSRNRDVSAFANNDALSFRGIATSPFAGVSAPPAVTLQRDQLRVLDVLYQNETPSSGRSGGCTA